MLVATSVRSDGCQENTKPSSLCSSTQFLHTVLLGCACRCISAPQMCVYTQAQFFLHSDPVPPEPPTDGWHPASPLARFSPLAFSRFRCAAQPQLRQSHTGILPPVGSGPQDTEPSFHEGITNTPGPERDLPLTGGGGNHGNWQQPQGPFFSVPLSPEPRRGRCRRQRSSEDRGVGIWTGDAPFRWGAR